MANACWSFAVIMVFVSATRSLIRSFNTVSWRHRRSKHWHQLDLILTRHSSLPSITITHSYQSADCDTDHSLVRSRVKLQTKRLYHTKKEGRPRIDINQICNQRKVEEFAQALQATLPGPAGANAPERWEHFKNAVVHIWQEDQKDGRLVRSPFGEVDASHEGKEESSISIQSLS